MIAAAHHVIATVARHAVTVVTIGDHPDVAHHQGDATVAHHHQDALTVIIAHHHQDTVVDHAQDPHHHVVAMVDVHLHQGAHLHQDATVAHHLQDVTHHHQFVIKKRVIKIRFSTDLFSFILNLS